MIVITPNDKAYYIPNKLQDEIWKVIEDYPNYAISSYGRVLNRKWQEIEKVKIKKGYYTVTLKNSIGKKTHKKIHRLVAEAFLPNPKKLPLVVHKDKDKFNNTVYNLEWKTNFYNSPIHSTILPATFYDVDKFDEYGHYLETIQTCESNIIASCREPDKHPSAYGSMWFFASLDKSDMPTFKEIYGREMGHCYKNAIGQFDLEGKLIKVYSSINQILKAYPYYSKYRISKCLKEEIENANDYIWKYIN